MIKRSFRSCIICVGSCTWIDMSIKSPDIFRAPHVVLNNPILLRQTACMFVHPVTVGNFAFLFNCTTVSRSADSVTAPSGGLEGWRLTVNVCGGPIVVLLKFFCVPVSDRHRVLRCVSS